eukprot:TRINITY_DN7408_c0_g1_i1.p1 TRINITY_DN7408_c0_g1~~TRINITY_DN7408_c0_g1_i1.p1  ORF type:complete len:170 (-),score=24.67 TRINITY_DN7408_c0_g1_i1:105-614(-)
MPPKTMSELFEENSPSKAYKFYRPAPTAPSWSQSFRQPEAAPRRPRGTRSPLRRNGSLSRASTGLMPDSLVLQKSTASAALPEGARHHLSELTRRVKQGESWSLAPPNNNTIFDAAAQMQELEDFQPSAGFKRLIASNAHSTYKMGKWSENAQIIWDYHREKVVEQNFD